MIRRKLLLWSLLVLGVVAIGALWLAVHPGAQAFAETPKPSVTIASRTATVNDREAGEVLVDKTVVFRILAGAGGFSPMERASITASRLAILLDHGAGWQDVKVSKLDDAVVLTMRGDVLLTATDEEAKLAGVTPQALARSWQDSLQQALRAGTPAVAPTAAKADEWVDWENPAKKLVPIFSIGTPGVQIGMAQVAGPQERVDQVKSVIQLDGRFKNAAQIYVYIPSSELAGIHRVQGVAVNALLQYKLMTF